MKYLLGIVLLVAVCQAYPRMPNRRVRGMDPSMEHDTTYSHPVHSEDFQDIAEAFQFPGSRYLHDLIAEHYETEWINNPAEIIEHFEQPQCDMEEFRNQAYGVYKVTSDPQGTALIATRYITKRVLHQKMKCPASIVDMYLVRLMYLGRSEFFRETDSRMYRFLMEKVPYVHSELAPYAEDVTRQAVEKFDKMVFNKTIEFMTAFGLRDVAFYSQDVYRGLWDYFKYYMPTHGANGPTYGSNGNSFGGYDTAPAYGYGSAPGHGHAVVAPVSSIEDTLQAYMWEVRCYDFQEMSETHSRMINMFRNEFITVENPQICVQLEEFLLDYMRQLKPDMDYNVDQGVFYTICEEIQDVVGEIMSYMEQYENALYGKSLDQLEEFMRDFISETDWLVFSEAARKLGFNTNWKSVNLRDLGKIFG